MQQLLSLAYLHAQLFVDYPGGVGKSNPAIGLGALQFAIDIHPKHRGMLISRQQDRAVFFWIVFPQLHRSWHSRQRPDQYLPVGAAGHPVRSSQFRPPIEKLVVCLVLISHRALLWASSRWSPRQAGEEPALRGRP